MAHARATSHGGGSADTIRPTARLTLAAALCVLVLPAGGGWVQQAHLFADDAAPIDWFGQSIAISGDTIVVGAQEDDIASVSDAGSAYVFTRTNHTWSQQDHLFADAPGSTDLFGGSVAIDGDTIVVGAHQDDTPAGTNAGSAYVFTRTGGTWSKQAQLLAGDAAAGDKFGESVAISGDTIVVGAVVDTTPAGSGAGSAYVFIRSGNSWSQQDHLFADDGSANHWFGNSVAISGDTIVAGANGFETASAGRTGAAYVFTRSGVNWSLQDHLYANLAAPDDEFGRSVAIDGDTIVVGAEGDDTAAAIGAGSAYVFTRSGATWSQQGHLLADDAAVDDFFGTPVAISGDIVVVGTQKDDTAAGTWAGSVYMFTRSGVAWSQQDHLFADDAAADDRFGRSVAIDGDTVAVGSVYDDTAGSNAGSAYVFGPPYLKVFLAEPELPIGQ